MKQKLESYPYVVALTLVGLAVAGHFAGPNGQSPLFPQMLFVAAVAVSAWLGGLGPGLVATTLSALAIDIAFIPPIGSTAIASWADTSSLFVFVIESVLICGLFHLLLKSKHQLEITLESSEAALGRSEEANQLKRNFIASMSHEIRAPLSSVIGYSDLLADDHIPNSEKKEYVDRLKVNASSLTQLVTDLLDVTEIDPGYFVANRRRMSVPGFMQKVYETFAPLAQEKGLRFQVHMRGSVPTIIESDQEQLLQILRHIVGNAIRYTTDGAIHVTISSSKTESERREIALIVTDQGTGIPNELKKSLFKSFAQTKESTKSLSGTGLGLTIARRLARGLGGDVKLAKSDRKGSTFLITLDAGAANQANEFFNALAEATQMPQLSPDDPRALEGIKVLVVDDSPDSAILVSRMLKLVGADVETAFRAVDGIEMALKNNHDLVLMDIQMPEIDGHEAIRRLRGRGFVNPIFALSAHVMREDKEEADRSGANDYIMKPVSRRALLQRISRYVHPVHPVLVPN